jgi:predicted aminopeptidase
LFRSGETTFNESLANAVAEEGVRRWLRHQDRLADLQNYEARLVRRAEFYDHIDSTRAELEELYESGLPPEEMRRQKAVLFGDLRDRFRELRRKWGGRGLEDWLTRDINNADLVSLNTYHKHVAAFHRLLDECGGDLDLFFKRAKHLKLAESHMH